LTNKYCFFCRIIGCEHVGHAMMKVASWTIAGR
jgi:hypothetical protein